MRLIDADKLHPDRMTDKGLAISQGQIASARTVSSDLTPATPEYQKIYMQGWNDGRRELIENIKREFKI